MNIYELDIEMEKVFHQCIDTETGEVINDKLLEKFYELQEQKDRKLEYCGCKIKDLEALEEAIKAEKKKLDARIKSCESQINGLKYYLTNVLNGSKFESAKVKISPSSSSSVDVYDQDALDKKFIVEKTEIKYNPDKKAIKEAIKAGEIVNGARIVKKDSVTVK